MLRLASVLFSILLVFGAAQAAPQAPAQPMAACQNQAPWGFAQTNKPNLVGLCHFAYLTVMDTAARIPAYVSYQLVPQNALGCLLRTNDFAADASLPGGPSPQEYAGTGYDKGHMSPDGDNSWHPQAETESFLMTNMAPQLPSLNRGIWKLLETSIRGWAFQQNHSFTIYVGPIYNANNPKIGKGVVVPHGYFKIVIDNETKMVAGWVFPHQPNQGNLGTDLQKFRLPISQIEQQIGIQFAFPPQAHELIPGMEWPVDYGKLTASKRAKCGANAVN